MEWLLKSSALNKLHTLHNIKSRCYATRKDRFHKSKHEFQSFEIFVFGFMFHFASHEKICGAKMASASIESLITCSICFERFTAPKTLPCEHSFCSHCLARTVASSLVKNDVLDTSKDITITCPICKDCVQGYQTISDIKNSLILKQLMDAHVADNEGMGGPACNCKRDAKFQCLDCDTRLCECCFRIPDNSCITNHFMSQISKNDSDEYLCVSHGISLDFFCTFCKIPVCLDCCMVSHKQHDVMTVSSQIKNKDEQIATCKQILDEYNSNCEGIRSILSLSMCLNPLGNSSNFSVTHIKFSACFWNFTKVLLQLQRIFLQLLYNLGSTLL